MESPPFEYRPSFPASYKPGVGIVGCGYVVKLAHLPAYAKYGVNVVGAYDISPDATRGVVEEYGVGRVFASLDELLDHSEIEIVDIATHPAARPGLIRRCLEAGKHVLAQKPLALDVPVARELVEEAERSGLKLAVNQNGRWSPPLRVATLLVERGVIGDVLAVTHLFDRNFSFVLGKHYDEIEHLLLYDHSVHWFDISRCWLDGKEPVSVRAREYRTPNQPAEGRALWGGWAEIEYADGSSVVIRSVGGSTTSRPGCPFWVHGTDGTIRGSVLLGSDFLELEREGRFVRYSLEGEWIPDGFAGTIGELISAVAEDREPYNSARHNLLSLQLTLAACRSAEDDGRPVSLQESG